MSLAARAFDVLYGSPPGDFVRVRKQLVAECKAGGDANAAKKIAAAKKPTQVAYLLNQLARRQPEEVAALVDIGRALERAQRTALRSGDSSVLREAIATQRKAVSTLTGQASALAKELKVHVAGHAVTGALLAALGDPAIGAALEAGTLQTPPEAVGTFGGGFGEGDLPDVPAPKKSEARPKAAASTASAASAAKKKSEDAEAARRAREERAAAAEAEKERRAAEREARREARAQATAAEQEADQLEAEAKKAVTAAEKARAHATRLREAVG